ncbi:hypothetical protein ACI78R_07175 [Geodermatophilus sp. SYSU D01106]
MRRDSVQRRLRMAISNLILEDWRLLTVQAGNSDQPVGEVSVACALGWHLRRLMDRSWDIDCEYNRAGRDLEAVVKRRRPSNAPDDERGRRVYPDLIVHRRGEKGRDNNLLVLELKTNHQRQERGNRQGGGRSGPSRGSLDSIAEVRDTHEYRHGVLLDLRVESDMMEPHWQWLGTAGREAAPHAVYTRPGSLRELCTRGRVEAERRYAQR